MKIEVKLKEIKSYTGVVRVFRGWHTAQQWIEEALLADGPEVEIVVRAAEEPEEVLLKETDLPFQDTDFSD